MWSAWCIFWGWAGAVYAGLLGIYTAVIFTAAIIGRIEHERREKARPDREHWGP
jgi:hypothetical protein